MYLCCSVVCLLSRVAIYAWIILVFMRESHVRSVFTSRLSIITINTKKIITPDDVKNHESSLKNQSSVMHKTSTDGLWLNPL